MLASLLAASLAFAQDIPADGLAVDPTVAVEAIPESGSALLPEAAVDVAAPVADEDSMEAQRRPYWRRGPLPPRRPPPPVVVVRHGHPAPAPAAPTRSTTHSATLSVSALHLAVGMAAVNAEFALSPNAGLGLTGGVGSYQNATLIDLGTELRGYAVGDFDRGLFLGLAGRFTNVPYYTPDDPAFAAAGVVGAKYTFDVPITLEGEVGPQIAMSDDAVKVGPMVKLNVGFSF